MADSLYQENLLDHYKYPRNRGTISPCNFMQCDDNPSCGDRVCFSGRMRDGKVTELYFEGKGCIISQAIASMLTEECTGKTANEIQKISKESVCSMVGIPLGPNRIKCALLPLFVLQEALKTMKGDS